MSRRCSTRACARVVIGSLAVKDPALVSGWIDEFGPERMALSLDVRDDR